MFRTVVLVIVICAVLSLQAATKSFPVSYLDPRTGTYSTQYYSFTINVISDTNGTKSESYKDGGSFIYVAPQEKYSVVIYNPLPVRVAVNLTIDGLSTVSGSPASPDGGTKWVVGAQSSITISGWQVSSGEARRFFFTSKEASYAKWRSNAWGKDLSVNCGVIGAAFFWSQSEIDAYYRTIYQPRPYVDDNGYKHPRASGKMSNAPSCESQRDQCGEKEYKAGTGMGDKYGNNVTKIYMTLDRGMYSISQAVLIYYDFGSYRVEKPCPFLGGFSPEVD